MLCTPKKGIRQRNISVHFFIFFILKRYWGRITTAKKANFNPVVLQILLDVPSGNNDSAHKKG
jgi:hypothetical protein